MLGNVTPMGAYRHLLTQQQFNQVVKAYRTITKDMDDDQAYKVSQQLAEFFT